MPLDLLPTWNMAPTVLQPPERTALHAVPAMAATAAATAADTVHPTHRAADTVAEEDQLGAAVQDRAGRAPVRPSRIHQLR